MSSCHVSKLPFPIDKNCFRFYRLLRSAYVSVSLSLAKLFQFDYFAHLFIKKIDAINCQTIQKRLIAEIHSIQSHGINTENENQTEKKNEFDTATWSIHKRKDEKSKKKMTWLTIPTVLLSSPYLFLQTHTTRLKQQAIRFEKNRQFSQFLRG